MAATRFTAGNVGGEGVATLHDQLARYGFTISPEEKKRRLYGSSTRKAVSEFQKAKGLPVTGVVDSMTARRLGVSSPADVSAEPASTAPVPFAGSPARAAEQPAPKSASASEETTAASFAPDG